MFISDIVIAQRNDKVLIINPHISDYIQFVKTTNVNVFGIFLKATKSTIENHLRKKGVLDEEITHAVLDSITQMSEFENNKNLFRFFIDVDGLTIEEIARQIAGELVIHNIASLRKLEY